MKTKNKIWGFAIVTTFVVLISSTPAALRRADLAKTHNHLLQAIDELEPRISDYPPNIRSDLERGNVKKKYAVAKTSFDRAIVKYPDDIDLVFHRGRLQAMGNNLDLPGAFEGAESDFSAVLKKNPKHEGAMVSLGMLYVNRDPSFAPKAESLFLRVQKIHGAQPLENAQCGLFFALYYQGRMEEARAQADLLTSTWPRSEKYAGLRNIVKSVSEKTHDAQRVEWVPAVGGEKVTKEFYADGTIKTVKRFNPDGSPLLTLYHATNGAPTYADFYDDQKRVRRTLLYRPDGTAHASQEFDEQHNLVMESRFDGKREATGSTFYLQQGRVIARSPAYWEVISLKLDASRRDVVGFQIPNPADEGTPDSANVILICYDLSQATNITAFAERKREDEQMTAKLSRAGDWSIYTFVNKQGDTLYEVRDAYRTIDQQYGLSVRLAFPELPKTTREWLQTMEADFKWFLDSTDERKIK